MINPKKIFKKLLTYNLRRRHDSKGDLWAGGEMKGGESYRGTLLLGEK